MMKIQILNTQVSVSNQIAIDDIENLKKLGVNIIICNRPDEEVLGQATFQSIKEQAELLGIAAYHIPFVGGEMQPSHIEDFLSIVKTGQKIHAYCRTGNRSTHLFNAAIAHAHIDHTPVQPEINPASMAGTPNVSVQSEAVNKANSAVMHFDVVIAGGGSAGIATAASLRKRKPHLRIAIIEPSPNHYYQPGWTMVGGGIFTRQSTQRKTGELIPKGVTWLQESVVGFEEEKNAVLLSSKRYIHYSHLVIAMGLQLDWHAIEGLEQTLGKNGVTSNYRYDLAPYTWELVKKLDKGMAIFTQPPMPIKCAGAPQKALYLSADYWFKKKCLSNIGIHFYNAGKVIFGIETYVPALKKYMKKYNAQLHFSHTLIKIDGPTQTAWFKQAAEDGDKIISTPFDMIHVCPPQSAPDVIKQSRLVDDKGWLDVNMHTLQHKKINNIWGLGDVTNTPNAKTMAAVRKQAPVVAKNICHAINQMPLSAQYDGYGSCPLTVERGKVVLAEFGYAGKLLPTFPRFINNGARPTKLAWLLKANLLPFIYWQCMLKGREWLTGCNANKKKP